MKIKFLGVGGAFAPISKGNSNMLLTSESGKKMLFDFGTTGPYILRDEWRVDFREIDAVFISHNHADHCGGLEQFAFSRYFLPSDQKPILFCHQTMIEKLWEDTLFGGLSQMEGKTMHLTDYFRCHTQESFVWEGWEFKMIRTTHIDSGYDKMYSYGLCAEKLGSSGYSDEISFLITSDSKFNQEFIDYYSRCKKIFQECETLPLRSDVHTHYDDLNKFIIPDIKKKMYLYHYSDKIESVEEDGFAGFVNKGDEFEI
jgi:ribonuclease BN (tRNA processing enzyme)